MRQDLGCVQAWFLAVRLTTQRCSVVRLPLVSRMASEIGDKDVVGCLAVPDCGYGARLHPTKPWLYLTTVSIFRPSSSSIHSRLLSTLLLDLQIVNFYHFLFPNIFQP
jgi:hypothetical protein